MLIIYLLTLPGAVVFVNNQCPSVQYDKLALAGSFQNLQVHFQGETGRLII